MRNPGTRFAFLVIAAVVTFIVAVIGRDTTLFAVSAIFAMLSLIAHHRRRLVGVLLPNSYHHPDHQPKRRRDAPDGMAD